MLATCIVWITLSIPVGTIAVRSDQITSMNNTSSVHTLVRYGPRGNTAYVLETPEEIMELIAQECSE